MKSALLVTVLIISSSCANPIKKLKYSAWEKVGFEKRDLFKREVSNVKEEQQDSGEAFKDALERLKEVYSFDGGNLEHQYNKLNVAYKGAKNEAGDANDSIEKLDTVANDLFDEWEDEIDEMKSKEYRKQSEKKLTATREKYEDLHKRLIKTEKKMEPVLSKLKDQVIFLKHNLNAEAIGGLKNEGNKIQADIEKLISEMQATSKEADEFIKTL